MLLADIGSLAIAPSVFPGLPFDPVKDFAPVVMVASSPHILAAHPSVPANNAKELIALARAKPNSLNFAISGLGGANHLAGIDFAMRTGIQWTYIPYKGGAQAIGDVMAGQAQVPFNGMLATYPSVKGGKLKALAISSAKRFAAAPDIPTIAESAGLPGFETGSFQGIVAPAGTSPEVVARLHAVVTKILATADMQERLSATGAEARPSTPAAFCNFIGREKVRWAKVVKDSGAKFEQGCSARRLHRRQAAQIGLHARVLAQPTPGRRLRDLALVHEEKAVATLAQDVQVVGLVRVQAQKHQPLLRAQGAEEVEHETDVAVLRVELRLVEEVHTR